MHCPECIAIGKTTKVFYLGRALGSAFFRYQEVRHAVESKTDPPRVAMRCFIDKGNSPFQEEHVMNRHALYAVLSGAILLSACQTRPLSTSAAPVVTPAAQAAAPAPAPAASMIAPMVEKRETFVATGYAVISIQNHKNPAQQRLLAIRASKLDAYRALTEQVYGQQLDASTTVSDMTVMNDTFRTRVEGVIYGAHLVSITPVGEDTYETTLSLDRNVVQDLRSLYLNQIAMRAR
jgi:hypothetical protein